MARRSSGSRRARPSRCAAASTSNYATILNLYDRVGDRVVDAWRRSFARFQRGRGRAKGAGRRDERRGDVGAGARSSARLDVLRALPLPRRRGPHAQGAHRVADQRLRDRRDRGVRERLALALRRRSRRRCSSRRSSTRRGPRRLRPADALARGLAAPFLARIDGVPRGGARATGIPDPIARARLRCRRRRCRPGPRARTSRVLESMCTLAPGDLVRLFRMTIQLLRQALHALPRGDPVVRTPRGGASRASTATSWTRSASWNWGNRARESASGPGRKPQEPCAGQASRVTPGLRPARDDRTSRPPRAGGDQATRNTRWTMTRSMTRWMLAGCMALVALGAVGERARPTRRRTRSRGAGPGRGPSPRSRRAAPSTGRSRTRAGSPARSPPQRRPRE